MCSVLEPGRRFVWGDEFGMKAKRIFIWENGEYMKYKRFVVTAKDTRSWNIFLNVVTTNLMPLFGAVWQIYSMKDHKVVDCFEDLEDNGRYIAIGGNKRVMLKEKYKFRMGKRLRCFKLYTERRLSDSFLKTVEGHKLTVIYVFLNGKRGPPVKLVLTQRDLMQWDAVLSYMSKFLDAPTGIEFLTTISGKLLCHPCELQHGRAYVAVPHLESFKKMDYMSKFLEYLHKKRDNYTVCTYASCRRFVFCPRLLKCICEEKGAGQCVIPFKQIDDKKIAEIHEEKEIVIKKECGVQCNTEKNDTVRLRGGKTNKTKKQLVQPEVQVPFLKCIQEKPKSETVMRLPRIQNAHRTKENVEEERSEFFITSIDPVSNPSILEGTKIENKSDEKITDDLYYLKNHFPSSLSSVRSCSENCSPFILENYSFTSNMSRLGLSRKMGLKKKPSYLCADKTSLRRLFKSNWNHYSRKYLTNCNKNEFDQDAISYNREIEEAFYNTYPQNDYNRNNYEENYEKSTGNDKKNTHIQIKRITECPSGYMVNLKLKKTVANNQALDENRKESNKIVLQKTTSNGRVKNFTLRLGQSKTKLSYDIDMIQRGITRLVSINSKELIRMPSTNPSGPFNNTNNNNFESKFYGQSTYNEKGVSFGGEATPCLLKNKDLKSSESNDKKPMVDACGDEMNFKSGLLVDSEKLEDATKKPKVRVRLSKRKEKLRYRI